MNLCKTKIDRFLNLDLQTVIGIVMIKNKNGDIGLLLITEKVVVLFVSLSFRVLGVIWVA